MTRQQIVPKIPLKVLAVFLLLMVGIIASGYLHFRERVNENKKEIWSELEAIASLKVSQIASWRQERYGDAYILTQSPEFISSVRRYLDNAGDTNSVRSIQKRLTALGVYGNYKDNFLVDPAGKIIFAVNQSKLHNLGTTSLKNLKQAVQSRAVVFCEVYYCELCHEEHLDVVAPLSDEGGVVALVVLRIDHEKLLYPLTQAWPLSGRTGKAVLAYQAGDQDVFLNTLPQREGAVLKLRPLASGSTPITDLAVLCREGVMEGYDDRNVSVVAAIRHIPDATWYLVAKMDTEEIYAPLFSRQRNILITTLLLVTLSGLVLGLYWQTERKRVEQELQNRQKLFMSGTIVVFKWLAAEGWPVEYVSPNVETQFGYDPDDFLSGRITYSSIVHPDDLQRVTEDVAVHSAEAIPFFEQEYRIARADGEYRWLYDHTAVVRDNDGTITHYYGYILDITERKRSEEALQKAHENLKRTLRFTEALLSAIPTPVFYKDNEGRYLGCNGAFTEIMGVTSEQIKGKTVDELWPSEHAVMYHSKDLELMKHPARQIYEFVISDKNGLEHPVIYSKDVFRDQNDQVAGIVGAFLDITDRKRAEEMIKAALQEKEVMLQEIHHRVKNNLQIITSLLNMQSRFVKDDEDKKMFQECRNRIRSMALVHDKLYKSTDLAGIDLFDYISELMRELYQSYGVSYDDVVLSLDIMKEKLPVNIAIPCGLIINELASNSFKYAFQDIKGKGRIAISLNNDETGTITLEMSDNGPGISKELDLKTVSTLGLQIVDSLVNQLQASIRINIENGTRVMIKFKI